MLLTFLSKRIVVLCFIEKYIRSGRCGYRTLDAFPGGTIGLQRGYDRSLRTGTDSVPQETAPDAKLVL